MTCTLIGWRSLGWRARRKKILVRRLYELRVFGARVRFCGFAR